MLHNSSFSNSVDSVKILDTDKIDLALFRNHNTHASKWCSPRNDSSQIIVL